MSIATSSNTLPGLRKERQKIVDFKYLYTRGKARLNPN